MNLTDSQLTKVYLVATGTAVATAANCVTAIAAGKELLCFQTFGEIGSTRSVQTYKCIDQATTKKSLGSFDVGNIPVEFLFDAADAAGQKELRDIYELGTRKICIVKLNWKLFFYSYFNASITTIRNWASFVKIIYTLLGMVFQDRT